MSMKSQRPDRRGWDKVAYEKHVDRLNNMKSSIDLKPPKKIILPNRAEADRVIITFHTSINMQMF